ncbi:lysoplasmalogenase TMEM86B isoform X2 [Desmodus rotundus]|uniref:lysoplasmalogenase TMEM86B isoform X2 n=1 Tax=Desmodus rotundus TaxID=9430 RepID=UPI0023810050|nr:lysoplasmalogenase isoform X2 [Desmodus rotundus]
MDARKEGLLQNARFSAQPRLVSLTPFFLTCAAYFLLWVPDDPPSWVGALVKCLPVLSLAGFLRTHSGGDCSTLLQMALLFSALGDVCLIWPQAFLYGVLAFTQAQLLYTWVFGLRPLRPGLLLPVLLVSLPFSGLLLSHLQPGMVLPLMAYGLALSTMLWRGLVRGGRARWGAVLFTISDTVLAWSTFIQPLAHGRLLVMATYYAAQFFIALSAFQGPRLKTN